MRTCLFVLGLALALGGCKAKPAKKEPPPPTPATKQPIEIPLVHASAIVNMPSKEGPPSPALEKARTEYIEDAVAFTKLSTDVVVANIHGTPMKDEWNAWEKAAPMTDARIKEFYKQTKSYIYDLAGWHLYDTKKFDSDMELVNTIKKAGTIKNVLDFGGGVGFNAFPIAAAGFDVTLADLKSVTLDFAKFRAKKRGIKVKYWETDVEPMPPDKKYDLILCLDVLEHLPQKDLVETVDKLVKLKHAGTQVMIHAPFGKTATHPMHLDSSAETERQLKRLHEELPKE